MPTGESGNGIRRMMGMQGIRVKIWESWWECGKSGSECRESWWECGE